MDWTTWSKASSKPLRSSGAAGCMGMPPDYLPLSHVVRARPVTSPLSGPWVPGPWRSSCSPGCVASVLAAVLSGAVAPPPGGLTRRGPGRALGAAARPSRAATSRRRSRSASWCSRPRWSRGRPDRRRRPSGSRVGPRPSGSPPRRPSSGRSPGSLSSSSRSPTRPDAALGDPLFAAKLLGSVWAIDTLRVGLISAMAAFVVASGAAVARARSVAVALSVVALFGIAVLGSGWARGRVLRPRDGGQRAGGAPAGRDAVDRGTARPHRPAALARHCPRGGRSALLHGRPVGVHRAGHLGSAGRHRPGSTGSRT